MLESHGAVVLMCFCDRIFEYITFEFCIHVIFFEGRCRFYSKAEFLRSSQEAILSSAASAVMVVKF